MTFPPHVRPLASAAGTALAASLTLAASVAEAHISFEQAGTHLSRYGDGEIKDGPCGRENGQRGTNVYTYEPGQTITISTVEFVPHPGYFRIAFDRDGDDDFVEPASIKPVDGGRKCPYDQNDKCGESDFYNNDSVLMDNLDPHVSDLFSGAKTYTWQVKLPDYECDNCTLQLIQVMEDTVHGPYSPKGASQESNYVEDIYHQCIDIVLKKGADPDDNPTPPVENPDQDGGTVGGDGDSENPGDGDAPGDGDDDGSNPGDGDSDGDGNGNGDDPDEDTSTDTSASTASDSGGSSCSVGVRRGQGALWLAPALLGLIWRRRGTHRR